KDDCLVAPVAAGHSRWLIQTAGSMQIQWLRRRQESGCDGEYLTWPKIATGLVWPCHHSSSIPPPLSRIHWFPTVASSTTAIVVSAPARGVGASAMRRPSPTRRPKDRKIAILSIICVLHERRSEIQHGWWRYRPVAHGAQRVGSGDNNSARRDVSRPSGLCEES